MANITIPQLPLAISLSGTEQLEIVQGGVSRRTTLSAAAGVPRDVTSIAVGPGSVSAPSYTFTGDLNTGMWSPGADTIAFSEGGAEAMRITSAGNVGIGTTAPAQRLHVRRDQAGFPARTGVLIQNRSDHTINYVASAVQFISGTFDLSDNRYAMIASDGGSDTTLQFWTSEGASPVERMRIAANGYIGIGTDTPFINLDMPSGSANFGGTVVGGTTISIGTVLAGFNNVSLDFYSAGNPITADAQLFRSSGVDGNLDIINRGAGAVVTKTGYPFPTESMRVTNIGNVGIGTSTPAVKLEVSSATGSATPIPTEVRISTTTNADNYSTLLPWGRLSFYSADTSDSGPQILGAIDAIAETNFGDLMSMDFSLATSGGGGLSPAMRISSDGFVTINNTLNLGPFGGSTIVGDIGGEIRFSSSIFNFGNFSLSQIYMYINSSGNVGIGTTTPSTKLDVVGDLKAVNLEASSDTGSATPTPTEVRISTTTVASDFSTTLPWGRLSFYSADVSDGGAKVQGAIDAISDTSAGGRMSMVFSTSIATTGTLTERMRLSANGNVTIITNQTTGTWTAGGASGTGTITLGQSTVSQTTNIQAGATASGSTKAINIGTGGLTGSTTTITLGSTFGTTVVLNSPIRLAAFTVATLPTAGTAGRRAYVTDALAPTFLAALVGGGAVRCPAFDNGTTWVAG